MTTLNIFKGHDTTLTYQFRDALIVPKSEQAPLTREIDKIKNFLNQNEIETKSPTTIETRKHSKSLHLNIREKIKKRDLSKELRKNQLRLPKIIKPIEETGRFHSHHIIPNSLDQKRDINESIRNINLTRKDYSLKNIRKNSIDLIPESNFPSEKKEINEAMQANLKLSAITGVKLDQLMTQENYEKYMNFLKLEEIEIFKQEKSIKTFKKKKAPKKKGEHFFEENVSSSHFDAENLNYSKNKESTNLAKPIKIGKFSISTSNHQESEQNLVQKMNEIISKVIRKVNKIENLNHSNRSKTCIDLKKIIGNNNDFLYRLFFTLDGNEINPNLNEKFILSNLIIHPPKFNRNSTTQKIKYNMEGIKSLELLIEKIRDFCFQKKLHSIQIEEKHILEQQKAYNDIENKFLRNLKQEQKISAKRFLDEFSPKKATLGVKLPYNFEISKMLNEFESKFGALNMITQKNKIIAKNMDKMLSNLYEIFRQ